MRHTLAEPKAYLGARAVDLAAENAELRSWGRIVPVEVPGGVRVWAVTEQALARDLLRDERMSHHIANWGAWRRGEVSPTWPALLFLDGPNMLNADPPEHTRLRGVLADAFKARPVEALRPRITEMVEGLLDELAAVPPGEVVDLKARFAVELPLSVFCLLFGITEPAHREAFRRLVETGVDTAAGPETVEAMRTEFLQVLGELIESRRTAPGDDLTSAMVHSLEPAELISMLLLMVAGGYETTAMLLTNVVRALCADPAQRALVTGGARPWSDAVEESLRHTPPVAHLFFRYATEDMKVTAPDGGHTLIGEGEPVMMALGAIGHDPDVHTGPGGYDLTRTTARKHYAFGHGIHHCVGAPLARLEAEIALPALFARFPHLALAPGQEPAEPLSTFIVHAERALPVLLGAPSPTPAETGSST